MEYMDNHTTPELTEKLLLFIAPGTKLVLSSSIKIAFLVLTGKIHENNLMFSNA